MPPARFEPTILAGEQLQTQVLDRTVTGAGREAVRLLRYCGSQTSRQSVCEGGKVVSPKHRPPLSPRKYPWYSFMLETELTPGP